MTISPAYQRWIVLGGLMLVYGASNGIVVHSLPLLYPYLIEDFAWSAAQVTLPATAFYIFGAITSPPAGALLDRFSPRKILAAGSAGMIASLGLYALATELWHVVAIHLLLGLSLSLCGLTACMVVLTRWFSDLRGRATGMLLMASSFGGAAFPQLLGYGLEAWGWRGALLLVACAGVVMTMVPLALLVRDKATQGAALGNGHSSAPHALASGPTLSDALRNPSFYLLAFATGALWFAIVALLQNQSIYLVSDLGVDRAILPTVFSVFFACSVLGKLAFGWIGDLIDKNLALILSILTFAAGLVILRELRAGDQTLLFVYACIAGIGFSGVFTTIQLSIANLFAGPSYGKILALLVMIDSLAGGAGANILAGIRDDTGTYQSGFDLMLGLCAGAIICVVMIMLRSRGNQPLTADQSNP